MGKRGPQRIYEVDAGQLPPYGELVDLMVDAGVGKAAAQQAAAWAELERAGIESTVDPRTEIRHRKRIIAGLGTPVPPRPGRTYEGQAEPLRDVGSTTIVATGAMAVVALAVLVVLQGVALGAAPLGLFGLLSITARAHIMGGRGGGAVFAGAHGVGRRLLLLRP